MTNGMPASTVATNELVVPKSIPTILLMEPILPCSRNLGKSRLPDPTPGPREDAPRIVRGTQKLLALPRPTTIC